MLNIVAEHESQMRVDAQSRDGMGYRVGFQGFRLEGDSGPDFVDYIGTVYRKLE